MAETINSNLTLLSRSAEWRVKRTFAKPLNVPFDQRSFGKRLKQAREMRGLSQAELGAQLGDQTSAAIAQWESGKYAPRANTLMELPALLRVSALWLFYGMGLPEQHGNGSINPRLRGLGGVRVPKVQSQEAARDIVQAAANTNDFAVAPHTDVDATDYALSIWDDRNYPDFRPGDEIIIRGMADPRPGDYAFVAVGPAREPEFGQLGRADDGNWLLHHKNTLWGNRKLVAGQDEIVAICLRRISVVRQP